MPPEIHDIVDDNLAADFDGSLSGLGVDIHAASFSMSEALNALPNLSISSSQIFKQEIPSPTHNTGNSVNNRERSPNFESFKDEPLSNSRTTNKNYGALDLSNDEAYLPETNENANAGDDSGPMSFKGSVSRESTPSLNFSQIGRLKQQSSLINAASSSNILHHSTNLSASNPNLSSTSHENLILPPMKTPQKVILPLHNDSLKLEKRSYETLVLSDMENNGQIKSLMESNAKSNGIINVSNDCNFQYILAASTSIATKKNEPSITYLNQGQAYELRMKKLGDLSHFRTGKKYLKSVLRICFHERRLQYIESEQIAEWSFKHPGERIIDLDLPLSYGVLEPWRDGKNINCLSFKWDPTRDTGIFIKVNCISTEFTPKKHGGEKGVPFR